MCRPSCNSQHRRKQVLAVPWILRLQPSTPLQPSRCSCFCLIFNTITSGGATHTGPAAAADTECCRPRNTRHDRTDTSTATGRVKQHNHQVTPAHPGRMGSLPTQRRCHTRPTTNRRLVTRRRHMGPPCHRCAHTDSQRRLRNALQACPSPCTAAPTKPPRSRRPSCAWAFMATSWPSSR